VGIIFLKVWGADRHPIVAGDRTSLLPAPAALTVAVVAVISRVVVGVRDIGETLVHVTFLQLCSSKCLSGIILTPNILKVKYFI